MLPSSSLTRWRRIPVSPYGLRIYGRCGRILDPVLDIESELQIQNDR